MKEYKVWVNEIEATLNEKEFKEAVKRFDIKVGDLPIKISTKYDMDEEDFKRSLGSKSFNSIWEEVKEYHLEDEVDTMNTLLQVMRKRGFVFLPNEFVILNTRGWMQSLRLNRCGMHRRFAPTAILDEMKDLHKAIKKLNK